MSRVLVRRAVPGDADEIVRICSTAWRVTFAGLLTATHIEEVISEFYAPERVMAQIAPAGLSWDGYVVAEREERRIITVGGGGLTEPTVGELFVLYADPETRRQGGGTAVVDFISVRQRKAGATEQWVSVEPGNLLARSFYEALGFVERGRRPSFEGDGESLRLSRPL